MASRVQRERQEDFLETQDPFRTNAFKLISKMIELINEAPGDTTHLLDEMLHSIFFVGKVNEPTFSPESILMDKDLLRRLRDLFPRAFELFSSHLPRRSPFSCVLDMIVHLNGPSNEEEILSGLRNLIIGLDLGDSRELISSTICVSYITDPDKFYGVSIAAPTAATSGKFNPRRCVISASCLYYWDECVAGAVLTYYPDNKMKPDYDGTIQLPQGVRCQAFSLKENRETPACKSCRNLFGLRSNSEDVSVYGNCAEAESLSNLFRNEPEIKERARPTSAKYSDEKRDTCRKNISKYLKNCLKDKKFTWKEGDFYIPS
ncbi:uncharacterized protein LOC119219476 [Pungitius pungitius]|uniref:uncharacterized protein LOC119219476 n=1 Tax=Pungitius pungitius TaxID=134920 RepID=UPI002E116952